MDHLPEDLVQYLDANKPDERQRALVTAVLAECQADDLSAAEYADRYARRIMRISCALGVPLI